MIRKSKSTYQVLFSAKWLNVEL